MYELEVTSHFRRKYKKLVAKNKILKDQIALSLKQLAKDPKSKNLRSHKITSSEYGNVFSSSVTGDIRIIWKEIDDKLVLLLLDIGGHSGARGVYK